MANMKTIAQNKKARHDYFVEETYEAGIFVNGMHISPYEQGNIFNRDPMRVRKLLMHKKEILKLYGTVKQTGYSLIPISLYFKDSKVKLQVGLCKGKSYTISVPIWQNAPQSVIWSVPLKNREDSLVLL